MSYYAVLGHYRDTLSSGRCAFYEKPLSDPELARHALRDAHRDLFLVSEPQDYKASPEVLGLAKCDLVPRDLQWGMTNPE